MAEQISSTVRALGMPELLSRIFGWIRLDEGGSWAGLTDSGKTYSYGCLGVLAHCALVNRLWCAEAVPCLYADNPFDILWFGGGDHYGVVGGLRRVEDPSRKAFFAGLIKVASMGTVGKEDAEKYDAHVNGLVFPQLHTLTLVLGTLATHITRVQAPVLRRLVIDPVYDVFPTSYALGQDGMDLVLDQIPILFPNLEEVEFDDTAIAYPGALERFAARLPRLRVFDHSYVIEEEERWSRLD